MMPSSESIDLSHEPLAASLLTAEQKERLSEILDRYLSSLERGAPLDPATLVESHPDLAEPLLAYLRSLDELHCAAAGFARSPRPVVDEDVESRGGTKRLGDFLLGRELGRGGMGIVYEARQISLDRTVALKVLPFAAVLDSRQIARFKSEAQAAAQILHPNIVPVFAIGADRGVHFYAMQFIDGQSLDLAIDQLRKRKHGKAAAIRTPAPVASRGPGDGLFEHPRLVPSAHFKLDETHTIQSELTSPSLLSSTSDNAPEYFRTVASLGIQAAEALHAAHQYGVVHRDVKPSNLLLDYDGKLWVTDFGLARCQREAALSQTGDIVGTMRYMSPEQASGRTSLVDQRTDVYSLGVTLYELLTLEPAVQGDDGPSLPRRIDQQNPRSLRQLRPSIPADLENVILKAIATAREDRYTTGQEFADDLRRFLEGKPTVAKPPTVTERVTKWAIRHRRIVAAVAASLLLAGIGFAASTILIAREKRSSDLNFARAEQNFRDAQEAVDRFGAHFAERLSEIPGAANVRREMLQETLAYYKRFVAQAADDPALRADLALTYSKIGTLADEIGSTQDAIEAHEKALGLFAALAVDQPRSWDHQRRLALCRNNLAMALRRAGRVDEAIQAYRATIDRQRQLARGTLDETYSGDLAISHTNLGLLLFETGEIKQAEQAFREAIGLQEQLVAASPDNSEHHRHLAVTLNNLSAIYVGSNVEQAVRCYQSALSHQQLAMAAAPENTIYTSDLAATYNNLGSLQSRQQEYTAAAVSYEQAIQLQQQLLRTDPSRKSYRQELAISLNNYGLMQSRLHRAHTAHAAFQQSITIQEPLVAMHPDDTALRSSLGSVYNNLGIALEEQRRFEEGAQAYTNAIEQQRLAYRLAPSVTRYRIFLSKHYFNLGRVLRQLGQPDRAAQVAVARRELWPKDGHRLFSVAEELAIASRDLRQSTGEVELTAERAASLAIETLMQAVEAGLQLPRDLATHETFSTLADQDRFLYLVSR